MFLSLFTTYFRALLPPPSGYTPFLLYGIVYDDAFCLAHHHHAVPHEGGQQVISSGGGGGGGAIARSIQQPHHNSNTLFSWREVAKSCREINCCEESGSES